MFRSKSVVVQIVIRICTLHYCASKKIFNCERMEGKWLGKWIIYIFEFKCFSGSVCITLISLKLTLCNLFKAGFAATRYFCRTADDWFWWGGADSEQRAQRATAAMWCQAGGGGGLLSHCPTLWPQLQPPVQPPAAHAQKHFSHWEAGPGVRLNNFRGIRSWPQFLLC